MATLTSEPTRARHLVPPDSELLDGFLTRRAAAMKLGLILGFLGFLIGVASVLVAPDRYSSTVQVWVSDAPVTIRAFDSTVPRVLTIDTEAQRATSSEVLALAGITLAPGGPIEAIDVTAPPVSKILQLHVIGASPEAARVGADALGAAYLEVRGEYLATRRDVLLKSLQGERGTLSGELVAAPTDAVAAQWEQELAKLSQAESRVLATTVNPGRVVRAASQPESLPKNVTVAPVSGFVLGWLAGYAIGLPLIARRKSEA
jgi:hypothetical protein